MVDDNWTFWDVKSRSHSEGQRSWPERGWSPHLASISQFRLVYDSGPPPGASPFFEDVPFPSPTAGGLFVPMASAGPIYWGAKLLTTASPDTASKGQAEPRLSASSTSKAWSGEHCPGSQDTLHPSCSATISSESSDIILPMPQWDMTNLTQGTSIFPPNSAGLQGQLPGNQKHLGYRASCPRGLL